jgi:hypothetical protein
VEKWWASSTVKSELFALEFRVKKPKYVCFVELLCDQLLCFRQCIYCISVGYFVIADVTV